MPTPDQVATDPETNAEATSFGSWAILELMGHRRLGGYVTEETRFGVAMCRIDVPAIDAHAGYTQYYTASAIYCVSPTTEVLARGVSRGNRPAPVMQYELPSPTITVASPPRRLRGRYDDDDTIDPDYGDDGEDDDGDEP